jgi:dTDP-4-amino-4,6-dideoxygalactose transaminase
LFAFRLEPAVLGISRESFLGALQAEGIPCSGGYVMPLYRQPLFANLAFGPYRGYESARSALDYRQTQCPHCEAVCSAEGAWLEQRLLLGTQADMDDIVAAFEKVVENRGQLAPAKPAAI